jgi:hypothetical protein
VLGSEKRLLAAMSQLPGIRSAKVQPGAGDEETVTFSLVFGKSLWPEKQVFTLCSALGAPILRMTRHEDDLEQIFLQAIAE